MTDRAGNQNALQGDFGESWVGVVASACGILHGRPDTLDLDKADVQLTLPGHHWDTYSPTVKVQVKTVTGLRRSGNGDLSYDLDVETYNVLRREDHSIRRVLVVVHLRDDGPWVSLETEGTLLRGDAYWVSVEGGLVSTNQATQVVHIPAGNRVDKVGLMRMLKECGVRRSTFVPDFKAWGDD